MSCYDERVGGFGGNVGHDAHLLYTLSAVQILALANEIDRVDKDAVTKFVASLQQPDGSFTGDEWGEIDTRFTYCALSTLSLLGRLDAVDVDKAAEYIIKCRNLDGGFGCVVGAESHAGQVFCCIGALSIAKSLHLLGDGANLLGWFLSERQVDSGGLNGRPEKQADVCYSWWILSALSIMGRVSWINGDKLATFILKCQDNEDGGIADRPDDMADVFHTFFGIAGLSLLGHLHKDNVKGEYRKIDPVYALPTDVVKRLGLQAQVLTRNGETVNERLGGYTVYNEDEKEPSK
jgi:geranylgeranyl transferase type-2 subunit beta